MCAWHHEVMKTLFLLALFLVLSLGLAGELATLHQQLAPAAPSKQETPQKSPLNLPAGVALAPGLTKGNPVDRSNHGIDEIGLERTRCLSNCPAYTVMISADGTFRYTGEYGVEHLGDHTGKVSVGQLNQVMSFINEAGFTEFETSYSAAFLDAPTSYVMVKKGRDTKVIENYANSGPATLWAIEQLIDDLLGTAEWNGEAQ
jgi:Domain of unknown function (DUF6438)